MDKSPDAFRTISEVADVLETPAHVLRFWESRFPQIKPVKRAGGRRYYRPSDVALLSGIKRLLHDEGLTIRGVQKILRDRGVRHVAGLLDDSAGPEVEMDDLDEAALLATLADGTDETEAFVSRRASGPAPSTSALTATLTDAAIGAFDDPKDDILPDEIDPAPEGPKPDLPLFPAEVAPAVASPVAPRPADPRPAPARSAPAGPAPPVAARPRAAPRATVETGLAGKIRRSAPGSLAMARPGLALLAQRLARLRGRLADRIEGSQV